MRLHLDDIIFIGQCTAPHNSSSEACLIPKVTRRQVVVTGDAPRVRLRAFSTRAPLPAFVEVSDPYFIPVNNARPCWLLDRRLAARCEFGLVHQRHIIGLATETDNPSEAGLGRAEGSPTSGGSLPA